MVLEYRTNQCTWHMVDAPEISLFRFNVEDDVKNIIDRIGENSDTFYFELKKLIKDKYMSSSGYLPSFKTELHIENKEKLADVKDIVMIAVCKPRKTEIHFFDSDFPFRICCNDGSVFEESRHFII